MERWGRRGDREGRGVAALVLGSSEEGCGDGAGHGEREEWRREGSRRGSREMGIGLSEGLGLGRV